jgi:hypothetical protein
MRRNKSAHLASSLALLAALFFTGCAQFRPGWVNENSFEVETSETDITDADFDGPLGGHFNDEGEWIPDDATIGWTYRIPDISAGFIFDIPQLEATPSLQVEIIEFDLPFLKYLKTWKLDFGVAHNRTFGYIGPRITSIFEISVGGFCGWNWKEQELSYGVGFTIIKF